MDNVCHTLVGAACGEAGLKRLTRFGSATLMVAANVPDIDVLVFVTSVPSVAFRRGWTHGAPAQIVLPIVCAAAMMAIDRLRPARDPAVKARWWPLLLLAYVGVFSHVFLDFLNTYGIRLLMPFSNRWFYGDSLFIVDPWLLLALGLGVRLARRRHDVRPARTALWVSAAYVAAMLISASAARLAVLDAWRGLGGGEPRSMMVGPRFFDPLAKQVIIDRGDGYEVGTFRWWPYGLRLEDGIIPSRASMPAAVAAREEPGVQALLVWARFPAYEMETSAWGTRVIVSDLRFGRFVAATSLRRSPPEP